MIPAAEIGGFTVPVSAAVLDVVVFFVVLAATYVIARLAARIVGERVRRQQVRTEMVVVTRRVAAAAVIVLGVFLALGWAAQNANVTLFGLLLATVVAALGVQQLLQDYVSGYYILLERHIRIGDRISLDGNTGTVTDVRMRVTLLRTDAGELVVVPNSRLFTNAVTIRSAEATTTTPPA
jgi:small conductance mechanosensitive channel